jgi:hypothetical protein
MSTQKRLLIETRGVVDWKSRLLDPKKQWKRRFSAYEAAVSWEYAARREPYYPKDIEALIRPHFGSSELLLAIGEHAVPLLGKGNASQCDVWALLKSEGVVVSLAVEAKVSESFGETVGKWITNGKNERAADNRKTRLGHVRSILPRASGIEDVEWQLLHRFAAAVIKAEEFGLTHAAMIIQAFNTPQKRFDAYERFCTMIGVPAQRGSSALCVTKDGIQVVVGWADCKPANDRIVNSVVGKK